MSVCRGRLGSLLKSGCIPARLPGLIPMRDATREVVMPIEGSKTRPADKASGLERYLSPTGKEAFNGLCGLGCDRDVLESLFTFLVAKPVRIQGTKGQATKGQRERPYYEISMHPLDQLETALRGSKKYDIRALQRTAQRAKKLMREIERQKRTPLVIWLQQKGHIKPPDLLAGSLVPGLRQSYFRGLLSLPKLAKQVGGRKKPDFERQLAMIYRHVHERTGGWHDQLIASVLDDLFPPDRDHEPPSPGALLAWRHRRELKG